MYQLPLLVLLLLAIGTARAQSPDRLQQLADELKAVKLDLQTFQLVYIERYVVTLQQEAAKNGALIRSFEEREAAIRLRIAAMDRLRNQPDLPLIDARELANDEPESELAKLLEQKRRALETQVRLDTEIDQEQQRWRRIQSATALLQQNLKGQTP